MPYVRPGIGPTPIGRQPFTGMSAFLQVQTYGLNTELLVDTGAAVTIALFPQRFSA